MLPPQVLASAARMVSKWRPCQSHVQLHHTIPAGNLPDGNFTPQKCNAAPKFGQSNGADEKLSRMSGVNLSGDIRIHERAFAQFRHDISVEKVISHERSTSWGNSRKRSNISSSPTLGMARSSDLRYGKLPSSSINARRRILLCSSLAEIPCFAARFSDVERFQAQVFERPTVPCYQFLNIGGGRSSMQTGLLPILSIP